jgi:RNA polymerase sigma-70 factor (ECF subfamily)
MDIQTRMRAMVDEHLGFVERTLRGAGVPAAELDDEIQRTFIIVARRLGDVQPGAERSFLFQVAVNLAAHARRKLARRREVLSDRLPDGIHALGTPEDLVDRKQMQALLGNIVDSMHESLRAVFMLYEIEELNLSEIAARLGVPRGTVASRLRRARKLFRQHVSAIELALDLGAAAPKRSEQPALLRRGGVTALASALLDTGACVPISTRIHAQTLAALGLAA